MKKIIKLLVILLLILPLSSCWDSVDLEELLIVYALGIDTSKEDPDNYSFTIAFPTILESAPEKKASFSADAPSLGRGKSSLQQKVYRELSYDNIKIVVFNEEAARQGVLFHMDSMLRIPLFRGTTRFAVVNSSAGELLELEPPVSPLISDFIFDSIQQNHKATTVPITTLRNFSNQYYTVGIEPSMPFISYDTTKSEIIIESTALFKGDKMIHRLSGINSRAFMFLKGEINQGIHTFEYISEESRKNKFISLNFINGKTSIKTEIIDSHIHIYHDISINAHLGEHNLNEYIFTGDKIKELEDIVNNEIKRGLEETVEILQKDLENDNVGYGKYVKANHPDFFDSEDWNSQFAKTFIHLTPKIRIRTVGVTP